MRNGEPLTTTPTGRPQRNATPPRRKRDKDTEPAPRQLAGIPRALRPKPPKAGRKVRAHFVN